MQILPVGTEAFHADGQTDIAMLIVAFRSFSERAQKCLKNRLFVARHVANFVFTIQDFNAVLIPYRVLSGLYESKNTLPFRFTNTHRMHYLSFSQRACNTAYCFQCRQITKHWDTLSARRHHHQHIFPIFRNHGSCGLHYL